MKTLHTHLVVFTLDLLIHIAGLIYLRDDLMLAMILIASLGIHALIGMVVLILDASTPRGHLDEEGDA